MHAEVKAAFASVWLNLGLVDGNVRSIGYWKKNREIGKLNEIAETRWTEMVSFSVPRECN